MPRTKPLQSSQFRTQLKGALDNVQKSVAAFARDSGKKIEGLVISSNVTLGVERPADTGVAVWFTWDGMTVCIAVDRYSKVEDNLQAIHHVIEARRTELRHGGLNIVRAAFSGFTALPSPAGARRRPWRDVFGYSSTELVTPDLIEARYRALARERHPDTGGSTDAMAELNRARDEALRGVS